MPHHTPAQRKNCPTTQHPPHSGRVVGHLAVIAAAALIANTALRTLGWPRHHLTHITAASAAATLWTPTSTWCLGLLLPALALAALAHTIIAIEEPACRQLATLYAAPLAFAIPATTLRIIPTADHASRWVLIAAVAAFLAVAKYSWWLIWTRPLTESLRLAAGSNG